LTALPKTNAMLLLPSLNNINSIHQIVPKQNITNQTPVEKLVLPIGESTTTLQQSGSQI